MRAQCPCCIRTEKSSGVRTVIRFGQFRRRSDQRYIQRYKCQLCKKTFSTATTDPCFRQLKRQFNVRIFELLASGVSQRRLSYVLRLNRKTIKRKFIFLGLRAKYQLQQSNLQFPLATAIQFDDLETFEHTKCKPLSVTLAVEEETRRILSYSVSSMPAKGRLATIALKKYGLRRDERSQGRKIMFKNLQLLTHSRAMIKSDQSPHYPKDVKKYFPQAQHITTKGGRGAKTGQGELKKLKLDPLFSLNHTFAKMRADINRLIRKTWCTTKRKDRLDLHIAMMAVYHNQYLLGRKRV